MAILDDLRGATREQHAELDASVDLARYPAFLVSSLAAVEQVEPAIARWLPYPIERIPALRADLDELGLVPAASEPFSLANRSEAWGAAYVLEGSTLGGMMLAENTGAPAKRYLRLRGKQTAARWKAFLAELAAAELDPQGCCAAAVATFTHYARAFRTHGAM